ncbi:hypothetical protein HF086_015028 [Spodoptera exigua]|uniref:Catalase immune-responsive domain-containing protein n=1 Tax=Spodoptera exigua TaxID=7107 RepID=A0A922M6V5_SPOEX|nr:hypothetical protein HF086_015028 [Spodoptera exigua]
MWYFYNYILEDEAHKLRFISNIVLTLVPVTPPVVQRVMQLLHLVDKDLSERVKAGYEVAIAAQQAAANAATSDTMSLRRVPSAVGHPVQEPQKSSANTKK